VRHKELVIGCIRRKEVVVEEVNSVEAEHWGTENVAVVGDRW
jgi:hypothetical protein